MLFINLQDGGPLQAAINRSFYSTFVFYVMIAFALTKMFAAGKIQEIYKREFERQISGDMSSDIDSEYEQPMQDQEAPRPQMLPPQPHQQQY